MARLIVWRSIPPIEAVAGNEEDRHRRQSCSSQAATTTKRLPAIVASRTTASPRSAKRRCSLMIVPICLAISGWLISSNSMTGKSSTAATLLFQRSSNRQPNNAMTTTLVTTSPPPKDTISSINSGDAESTRRNESIYFVHIGKAGGETIKSVLEFGCLSRLNRHLRAACFAQLPESQLSQSVRGYFHCFQETRNSISPNQATAFMFSLRHPLDRTTSWFHYVHPHHCRSKSETPQNCMSKDAIDKDELELSTAKSWMTQFFVDCHFNKMQDWAQALEPTAAATTPDSRACHELARKSLLGGQSNIGRVEQVPLAAHLIANIGANYDITAQRFSNASVYVIRTESLWDDLQRLDKSLGGTGTFGKSIGTVNNPKRLHISKESNLSTRHVQLLCCSLESELFAYKTLVAKAKNLSPTDKAQTLDAAMTRCHFETWDDLSACERK